MPKRAKRPCNKLGCSNLADGAYCEQHQAERGKRYDDSRGNTKQRGYGKDWQRLARRFARANPLCKMHKARGEMVPMDLVDHIVPIAVAPGRRLDESNLQSLCRECHQVKTDQDRQRYAQYNTKVTHLAEPAEISAEICLY